MSLAIAPIGNYRAQLVPYRIDQDNATIIESAPIIAKDAHNQILTFDTYENALKGAVVLAKVKNRNLPSHNGFYGRVVDIYA